MKIGLFRLLTSDHVLAAEKKICSWLEARQCDVLFSSDLPEDSGELDVLITLGGDGTILKGLHLVDFNVPVLAVAMGRLGFLAETAIENIDVALSGVLEGNYFRDQRELLDVTCQGKHYFALNEVVIKQKTNKIVTIETLINGLPLTSYQADGLIVSTPTGSTAYNLSAGGPILSPKTSGIILSPICPHTFTMRSLVIPGSDQLLARPVGSDVSVIIDGTYEVEHPEGESIQIGVSSRKASFIRFSDEHFFPALRKKLNWRGHTVL
jgi:NAD+ kinase